MEKLFFEQFNREKDKTDYQWKRIERRGSGKSYSGITVNKTCNLFSKDIGEQLAGKYLEVYTDIKNNAILLKESGDSEYSRLVKYTKSNTYSISGNWGMPLGRYYFKRKVEGEGWLFIKADI